jgi:hypothetical protein
LIHSRASSSSEIENARNFVDSNAPAALASGLSQPMSETTATWLMLRIFLKSNLMPGQITDGSKPSKLSTTSIILIVPCQSWRMWRRSKFRRTGRSSAHFNPEFGPVIRCAVNELERSGLCRLSLFEYLLTQHLFAHAARLTSLRGTGLHSGHSYGSILHEPSPNFRCHLLKPVRRGQSGCSWSGQEGRLPTHCRPR